MLSQRLLTPAARRQFVWLAAGLGTLAGLRLVVGAFNEAKLPQPAPPVESAPAPSRVARGLEELRASGALSIAAPPPGTDSAGEPAATGPLASATTGSPGAHPPAAFSFPDGVPTIAAPEAGWSGQPPHHAYAARAREGHLPVARSLPWSRGYELGDLKPVGMGSARPPVGGASHRVLTYTVREGDTLWDIAARFNTDVETLENSNPELDPELVQPGDSLRVLANATGVIHRVEPGDTLSTLALDYGISETVITEANGLSDPSTLQVGQELVLVGAKPPRPTARQGRGAAAMARWAWPLQGAITSHFGPRWGEYHYGLDIGADTGTPVVAARSGRVVKAGWQGTYGYAVLIDHGDGTTARYAHASRLLVSEGQEVSQGETIMLVGSTGRSTGPHLHFEVLVSGVQVDPLPLLP